MTTSPKPANATKIGITLSAVGKHLVLPEQSMADNLQNRDKAPGYEDENRIDTCVAIDTPREVGLMAFGDLQGLVWMSSDAARALAQKLLAAADEADTLGDN